MLILGIESSCDETAAAIVRDGRHILSSIVASQINLHAKYGGVVPEIASREHLRRIVPTVREALSAANLSLHDLDAVAVTFGPGLIGSLLVGLTYGKTLASALDKPLIAVNHLEGHVHAVFLEAHIANRAPALPAVCLIVSGGHTVIYSVAPAADSAHPASPLFHYSRLAATRDDAAGEAYDKVARLLALGFPGGPVIDQLAAHGNPSAVRFTTARMKGNPFDFSFSGTKTAVLYHVRAHPELAPEIAARQKLLNESHRGAVPAAELLPLCSPHTLDLIASFQHTVVTDLVTRTLAAAVPAGARSILVSGGVAANSLLRTQFQKECSARNLDVFFPSRALSTDNAAMIAAAAFPRLLAGLFAPSDLNPEPVLPLA